MGKSIELSTDLFDCWTAGTGSGMQERGLSQHCFDLEGLEVHGGIAVEGSRRGGGELCASEVGEL